MSVSTVDSTLTMTERVYSYLDKCTVQYIEELKPCMLEDTHLFDDIPSRRLSDYINRYRKKQLLARVDSSRKSTENIQKSTQKIEKSTVENSVRSTIQKTNTSIQDSNISNIPEIPDAKTQKKEKAKAVNEELLESLIIDATEHIGEDGNDERIKIGTLLTNYLDKKNSLIQAKNDMTDISLDQIKTLFASFEGSSHPPAKKDVSNSEEIADTNEVPLPEDLDEIRAHAS